MPSPQPISITLFGFRRLWPENLGFPFILPSVGDSVEGEIYFDIDEITIKTLDQIEGEGQLYHRIKVTVEILDIKKEVDAWTYIAGNQLKKAYNDI